MVLFDIFSEKTASLGYFFHARMGAMSHRRAFSLFATWLALPLSFLACGGADNDLFSEIPAGSAGATSQGGTSGASGKEASGGAGKGGTAGKSSGGAGHEDAGAAGVEQGGAAGVEQGGAAGAEQSGAGQGGNITAGAGGEAGTGGDVGGDAGQGGNEQGGGEQGGSTTAGVGGDAQGGNEPGGEGGTLQGGNEPGGNEPGGAGGAGQSQGGAAQGGGGQAQGGAGQGGSTQGGTGGTGGAAPSVCGDGKVTGNEECDDGGKNNDDGCSKDCKITCSDFDKNAKINPENKHCYWTIGSWSKTWEQQVGQCAQAGGHLVTISSEAENKFILQFHTGKNDLWIGATDGRMKSQQGAGTYKWITNEPFSYKEWASGEPNAADCGYKCYEHCAVQRSDGLWNDVNCGAWNDAICEWEPPGL